MVFPLIAQKPIAACHGKQLKLHDQGGAVSLPINRCLWALHSNQLEDSPPWYLPTCHALG
jgi:hypothetical protein